jgi:subtilisin family serine protease
VGGALPAADGRFRVRATVRRAQSPLVRRLEQLGTDGNRCEIVQAANDDEAALRAAFAGAHGIYGTSVYNMPAARRHCRVDDARGLAARVFRERAGGVSGVGCAPACAAAVRFVSRVITATQSWGARAAVDWRRPPAGRRLRDSGPAFRRPGVGRMRMAMARTRFPSAVATAGLLVLCAPPATAQGDPAPAQPPSGIVLPPQTERPARRHDDASILVRFKPSAAPMQRSLARTQVGGARLRGFALVPGLEVIRLGRGWSVDSALEVLRRLPAVAYAHKNLVIHIDQQLPDDQFFAEQWALHNVGQGSLVGVWPPGTPDADIDWPEAWAGAAGGSGAVVAIMDTGIDWQHSDLAPNVWLNAAEAGGSAGVDDDGNGYVDDVRGWDFAHGDNQPLDLHGHGSHVAGIVGAVVDNAIGVSGVMWKGKVMALQVLDDTGYGLISDAVAAVEYAAAKGVRVANASWGYSALLPEELDDHQALYDAIQAAAAVNLLVVAAAGNESSDTDLAPHYPSAFDLGNVISVAATDNDDQLTWFSNWGATSVDLGAPGDYVFSTYKRWGTTDDYAWLSGTSMAAPHVAGVAGLLAAIPACDRWGEVRHRILTRVRPVGALTGLTATGGVVNLGAALAGTPCPALTVTTASVPVADVGASYAVQLAASGGVPPYSWSLAAGALPQWASLSGAGLISGVVATPVGNYNFTVRVTDSTGATATRAYGMLVRTPPSGGCGGCH